jgi:hypothetical protein
MTETVANPPLITFAPIITVDTATPDAGFAAKFSVEFQITNNGVGDFELGALDLTYFLKGVPASLLSAFGTQGTLSSVMPGLGNDISFGMLGTTSDVYLTHSSNFAGGTYTLIPDTPATITRFSVNLTQAQLDAMIADEPILELVPDLSYTYGDFAVADSAATPPETFGAVPSQLDVGLIYSPPVVQSVAFTRADGSAVDLSALNADDQTDGITVTVTFNKAVSGVSQSFVNSGGGISSVYYDAPIDPTAVHTFKFYPSATNDLAGMFSFGTFAGIVDTYGNALSGVNLSSFERTIAGDTMAPPTPFLDGTKIWAAHGALEFNLSMGLNEGERYEVYDDTGKLLGATPSYSSSIVGPQYYYLQGLAEGDYTISVKVVDAAGNASEISNSMPFVIDTTPPEVLSITKVQVNPETNTALTQDEAGFLIKFSEGVTLDYSAISVTGMSAQWMGMKAISGLRSDGAWGTVDPMSNGATEIFVRLSSVTVGDMPNVQIAPSLHATEFVTLAGAPADLSAPPANAATLNWMQVRFDGELYAGELVSGSVNLHATAAQDPAGRGFSLEYVSRSTVDPTSIYVASSSALTLPGQDYFWSLGTTPMGTGNSPLGGWIGDKSYNLLTLDPGISDYYTLVGDETDIIKPETGPKGLDFIDLSALNGSVVIDSEGGKVTFTPDGSTVVSNVFDFHSFEGYTLTDNGGNEFLGSAYSEIVTVGDGDGNTLRANNRDSGDKAPETDIVDYSQTTNAITVNLGNNASADITVSRAGLADGDVIAGFEGVIGSQGADTITGSGIGNFLAGAEGADQIFGMAGDDILIGGAGADEIHGGAGSDLIIDLDGGDLYGSETEVDRDPDEASENDVFVVRTGSSIHNFHLSGDGTGLAGRSGSANDAIIFSISLAALAVQVDLTEFLNEQDEVIDEDGLFEFVGKNLVFNDLVKVDGTDDQRLVVKFKDGATLYDVGDVTLKGLSAQLEATEAGGKNYQASVVELDWLTDQFNINLENFNSKIDMLPIYKSGQGDDIGELAFAVALEAVREGTVRGADSRGVMAGNQSLDERIYNPGFGDERIIGASGKDRYEFLLQTLSYKDAQGNDVPSAEAGTDRVFDIGGYDVISFSDVALNELHFSAVKVGREAGANSLKVTYSQTAQIDGIDVVNNGEIIWQGHFKEGGRMAAEALEIGPAASASKYVLAQTKYAYDENGYVLGGPRLTAGDTKDASGNDLLLADTLLIGRGDSDVFVFETSSAPTTDGTNDTQAAHIWNFNTGDLIDVSDYVDDFGSLTVGTLTTTPATATGASTAAVDLTFSDGGGANDDLVLSLTFYDAGLTQLQLEEALGLNVPA